MTATYDPAESERLEREAREDDARIPAGPWTAGKHGYVSAPNPAGGPSSTRCPLRDNTGDPRVTDAIARTRNNLRAMADQLEAARDRIADLESELDHVAPASERDHLSRASRRMVETVMGDRDALRQRVRDLERELATLRSSVVAAMSSAGPGETSNS